MSDYVLLGGGGTGLAIAFILTLTTSISPGMAFLLAVLCVAGGMSSMWLVLHRR